MKTRAQISLISGRTLDGWDVENLQHIIGQLNDELKHADNIGSHFASFPITQVEEMIERLQSVLDD